MRLGVVVSRGVERFVYTYDYGDNWRHDVIVEEVHDGDPDREYPAFVDGAKCCPPEDVGGPDGFMDFLEAVLDPAHEQHREMVRWYGGPFDPMGFDEERARFCMENMVRRRRGPLTRPVTGADRGAENDDRGAWDDRPYRPGVFGRKSPSDAEGTQERS